MLVARFCRHGFWLLFFYMLIVMLFIMLLGGIMMTALFFRRILLRIKRFIQSRSSVSTLLLLVESAVVDLDEVLTELMLGKMVPF